MYKVSETDIGVCNNMPFIRRQKRTSVENTIRRKRPRLSPCNWDTHNVNVFVDCGACHKFKDRYGKSVEMTISTGKFANPDYSSLTESLKMKSRNKIKDQSVNLAMALAQYRQTASLWDNAARDIVRAWRDLKKGRWSKSAASEWLKFQYGILPTLSDINGACVALDKDLSEGVTYPLVVSVEETQKHFRDYERFGVGTLTYENTYVIRMRNYMEISIVDPMSRQLTDIGFGNPMELLWELIPFSFVIDWMIPVGDWLSALDGLSGSGVCGHTEIKTLYFYRTMIGGTSTPIADSKFLSRRPLDVSMPSIGAAFKYEPSTHATNILNGLALLRSLR